MQKLIQKCNTLVQLETNYARKNFTKVLQNLIKYRFENNFVKIIFWGDY